MQVDIEADEIDLCRLKEFGGRKRTKSAKAMRIDRFGLIDQAVNESLDFGDTTPAHDFGGDFVNDAEGEHGRVSFAGSHGSPDSSLRPFL